MYDPIGNGENPQEGKGDKLPKSELRFILTALGLAILMIGLIFYIHYEGYNSGKIDGMIEICEINGMTARYYSNMTPYCYKDTFTWEMNNVSFKKLN